jgi:hypothetical protein
MSVREGRKKKREGKRGRETGLVSERARETKR